MEFCLWKYFPILLQILVAFPNLASSGDPFLYSSCFGNNYTKDSPYETNLNAVLSSLPSGVDEYGFNSSSFGQNPDTVNTIALCRGDVEIDICRGCVRNATGQITISCPNNKKAIVWYDYCMLRYSDESILGKQETEPTKYQFNQDVVSNASNEEFNLAVGNLFMGIRENASSGSDRKKFASGSIIGPDALTIFGFMQCSPDLTYADCKTCLLSAKNFLSENFTGKKGCKVSMPSCNIRYEIYDLVLAAPPPPPPIPTPPLPPPPPPPPPPSLANIQTEKHGVTSQKTIMIVAASIVSFVIVLCFCIFLLLKRKKHKKPQQFVETMDENISVHDMSNADSLQCDFRIISEATDGFSNTNTLGEGGFGTVYKGRLQNGQEIAVKRLSRNSGQGEHEFKNEVMLVAKLQHRNLVRLLGFSLKGSERLLIYEFVTNSSLDQFIFHPIKRVLLDWDMRYKIINGIAKGLLYLHEDSRLRIIHRDLKASNILLDSEMLPKISDFGMARLMDEAQGSTSRIVGTYGYMAPEYIMQGHFSVKSDVFSFGVLVLEIVSGQKNNSFLNGKNVEDLISNAWKSWREGTATSLIDPTLKSTSSSTREMMRCIHIGLLCVQESLSERPTMASILLMLSSSSLSLPLPLRPAFFLEGDMSGKTDPAHYEDSILYPRSS